MGLKTNRTSVLRNQYRVKTTYTIHTCGNWGVRYCLAVSAPLEVPFVFIFLQTRWYVMNEEKTG